MRDMNQVDIFEICLALVSMNSERKCSEEFFNRTLKKAKDYITITDEEILKAHLKAYEAYYGSLYE